MNRLIACVIGAALLAGGAGLMIAKAQQAPEAALIAGDRPVTAEQVWEKLQSDGWSNVVISRNAGGPKEIVERHNVILKRANEQVEVAKVKF